MSPFFQLREGREVFKDACRVSVFFMCALIVITAVEPHLKRSEHDGLAKAMLAQTVKWLALSSQDKNASSGLQHATYAMAYLNAARHVASDTVLERLSGIDIHKLSRSIDMQQQARSNDLNKQCPKLRTKMPHGNGWLT